MSQPLATAPVVETVRGYLIITVEEASGKNQVGDALVWETVSGTPFEAFVKGECNNKVRLSLGHAWVQSRIFLNLRLLNLCPCSGGPRRVQKCEGASWGQLLKVSQMQIIKTPFSPNRCSFVHIPPHFQSQAQTRKMVLTGEGQSLSWREDLQL